MNDRREAWMDLALCTQLPPDMWFPPVGDHAASDRAKAVCADCPVRKQCLDYAIENAFDHGIYGGMSAKARQKRRQDSGVVARAEADARAARAVRIEELNRQGVSDEQIAVTVGVNPSTVSRIRRELGLPVVGRAGRPRKEEAA